MAPGAQAVADDQVGRSGGKVLKARTAAARKTPYDRPTRPQPPLQHTESSSWLTGLALPAKFVAGGASKILSSFWNPKSWGDPSFSSSESDTDSDSEDDPGDNENPSYEVGELNQRIGRSSGKSETLHLVEQLLMLEHYSREECDRLTQIISSRVIDYPLRERQDAGPSNIHNRTNNETPDIRSQAIMEAKKWVSEKKVGSGLRSDLDNGIYPLKSVTTPQSTEAVAGSPVDVAKSYMRARPPWASPMNHNNSPTPSPLAADLFKERTPYSNVGGISFPSAKRDYLSAGSWNIHDEIRKLRSKATEDMLTSHRSIRLASSSLANDNSINVTERDEPPTTFGEPKFLDTDTRMTGNNSPTQALPSQPTTPVQEQYQAINTIERQEAIFDKSHDTIRPDNEQSENGLKDDINCYLMTESTEVPVVNDSQDNSNSNEDHQRLVAKVDGPTENQVVTRAGRRVGKGRGK